MEQKRIRTRYAPSPTGRMHVGNLRTALYAYLIAKHGGGDFLLRIEDTDQERFVEGALEIIYNTLAQTGLNHDEGPDKGGNVGPYVQSERNHQGLYLPYAIELIEKKEAYYCFCTKERLDSLKQADEGSEVFSKYDKHCLHLTEPVIAENLSKGIPYVIRQNNPVEGKTSFQDDIYGEITVDNSELDDMILIKSDGFPTYNFANVVDDHLMGITHVVRGNEYLASSPKYNRLYGAFGWDVPIYVHCPLITNEAHQKLSKRSGHSSFEDLVEQGFLTEAIVNYVALLGWSPGTNEEIFSLEQLIEKFDYKNISKSSAVFDMQKFRWMNSEYIKKMTFEHFYELAEPELQEALLQKPAENSDKDQKPSLNLRKIAELIQSRIETLKDIPAHVDFFGELPSYSTDLYTHKKMKTNSENSLEQLEKILPLLEAQEDWTLQALHDLVMEYVAREEIKNGLILWPIRTALSGKSNTAGGAFEIADIIGKEESLRRMRVGIEMLKA